MADPKTRHTRGLWIVILLAVIFFTLLALIILKTGDGPAEKQVTANETLTVLPVRIRVRTEPHARAPVVATATSGERVTLLEDRGAWVRVQTGDGLSGWAERANLERTLEQKRRLDRYAAIRNLPPLKGEVTQRAQLYAGPGIFYPLVGELSEGADVTVFTRDHDFYAVQIGNSIAYADVEAIDISASGTQFDVRTASTDTVATITDPASTSTAVPPQTASAEPPPIPEPEPEPAPVEPAPVGTGVYSAVPAGGTQPRELERVVPRYPQSARRRGIEGAVVVRGIVRRDGSIDNVEVIKDLPYGLGDEARRAVSRWRFRPATYRGEEIDVYYTVTVNFRLQ
ncbi:MAG TPA: TonB family protein [Thermoanaerobaculia bacterium]|nr:TonB family protein [Thermoanaerobaculia bacterium]